MALVIGEGFGPSTWGALRSIIFNGTLTTSLNYGSHNIEYDNGFKTTEGNGFVRTDYSALYLNGGIPNSGPNFNAEGITATPAQSRFGSYYNFGGGTSSSGMLVNEDRSQLTGETVVLSSGSRTIAASAFVSPNYQLYSAYNSGETISTIGKLTAL